ncbi:hypothetical protein MUCCIDRAFT_81974 [Mucor lusitanicus CBS 277.49]|uniref:Uncharacterized protein n=1 Tax=Mucor lusitanicus CBS 277.49 TaxID=747725 RepID=A0A162MPM4_MUCCL|nr:hypothetical protein MUCCIDRAFT_81974 [Mucor lusitanicus CBS 277.49]
MGPGVEMPDPENTINFAGRLVQEKQAPAATGIQPPLPQPAQFRPFVVRERGQRFEFNQDEPNWAMGIDTIVILSDQLPINLLHGPNQNVNLYINPDFNSTNKKDRHLRILRSDGQLMGLGHTPNYCLLTFGPNSQYRTNIFFPYLPLMDENKAYKISNTVLEVFVNTILLPALRNNIACNLSIRRGVLPAPKYTNAATVHAAIPAMRDIIDQLGPDHDCHVFREFKLMTFTYGIKTSFYKAQRQKQISNTYDITLKDVATTVNAEDYTGIFISYYCKCGGQ